MALINNPQNFNPENPADVAFLGKRIAEVFSIPALHQKHPGFSKEIKQLQNKIYLDKKTGQLQMMATPDDYPDYLLNLFAEFSTLSVFDRGYENIFDIRPLSGEDGYDVYSTETNCLHTKILPGGKIKYYGSKGSRYRVYVDFYGGGLGVDRRLILTKNFYQIQKDLIALRNSGYLKMAQVAYGLIEAIGSGINLAWAAHPDGVGSGTSGYQVGRDIASLNQSRQTLIANNKDKVEYWPGGVTGTAIGILADYSMQGRLERAYGYAPGDAASRVKMNGSFLPPIYTTLLTGTATTIYPFIPKAMSTGAVLLDFTQFVSFNKDNLTDEIADWTAFVFNVGDTAQFTRQAMA